MAAYQLRERGAYGGGSPRGLAVCDRDDIQLRRLGKKPSLKRSFGMLSLVGFSCIILLTWEGIVVTFDQIVRNGGPAGVMYSYFFAWTGTACCFLVLGELASMAPTAGGQYHWCAMLAPMNCMKFLSYVTGWLTTIGWQVANAATNHLCAALIQNIIKFDHPSYNPASWKRIIICWCVQALALGANLVGGKFLPRLETFALVIHVLGFFGIMIPLAYMSEHKTSKEVFQEFWNTGEFTTQSLSWLVGTIACAGAFSGGDGAVHMAEEVENPAVALPQALLLTLMINGFLGIGMVVVLLYCMDNVELSMRGKPGYSSIEVFYLSTGSRSGTMSMSCLCVAVNMVACFGVLAPASRQIWSLARDRGIPGWRYWRVVSSRKLPTNAIYLAVAASLLISLIDIGSEIAHTVIISIAIPGWYSSYLIVEILLLYRRCRGQIALHADNDDTKINIPGERLVWGQFRVPGIWGILVNCYALVYTVIVIFFSFWPSKMRPTAADMNYSVVSTGGTVLFAIVYYISKARHVYRGPIKETNVFG